MVFITEFWGYISPYFTITMIIGLIRFLYLKNLSLLKIFTEFSNLLPSSNHIAKKIDSGSLENTDLKGMTVLNMNSQKNTIKLEQINMFMNKLDNFDYTWILFKKYTKSIIQNLLKFDLSEDNYDLNITVVQTILKKYISGKQPIKPHMIFWLKIKYDYKITSFVYRKMMKAIR